LQYYEGHFKALVWHYPTRTLVQRRAGSNPAKGS